MTTTKITTDCAVRAARGPRNLTGVLEVLERRTRRRQRIDVDVLLDAFGGRLIGPLLVVPALLLISPLGAVPFLPAVLAIFILLVAAQQAIGGRRPWVPRWLARCSVDRRRLVDATQWLKPITRRVDRLIKPRMVLLVCGPMRLLLALAACVMALLVFPLAPIPFAVQLPAWGLVMLGLAMIAHDGALAALGLTLALATVGLTLWVLL